jgi:hypothetical protein
MGRYTVSLRRACGVARATRSSVYYRSRKDPLTTLRQRMRELARPGFVSGTGGCGSRHHGQEDERLHRQAGDTTATDSKDAGRRIS